MKISSLQISATFTATILFGSVLLGCGSARAPEPATGTPEARNSLEISCEAALIRLETLIESGPQDASLSVARRIEAKELLQMGKKLYLEREYALALELLADGIQLVEEPRD